MALADAVLASPLKRKFDVEGGSLAQGGCHPNPAAMPLDNAPARGQAQADSARAAGFVVQLAERTEDRFRISRVDSHSIVTHVDRPTHLPALRRQMDTGRLLAVVLDGVLDEVLKQLSDQDAVRLDCRQRIMSDDGVCLLN